MYLKVSVNHERTFTWCGSRVRHFYASAIKSIPQDKSRHCSLVLVLFSKQQGSLLWLAKYWLQCAHFLVSWSVATWVHDRHLDQKVDPVSRGTKLKRKDSVSSWHSSITNCTYTTRLLLLLFFCESILTPPPLPCWNKLTKWSFWCCPQEKWTEFGNQTIIIVADQWRCIFKHETQLQRYKI